MSTTDTPSQRFEKALGDPTSVFNEPQDVLLEPHWTREQRAEILEQWLLDARRLQESSGESMTGGEPSLLQDVSRALAELKKEPEK